MDGCMCVHKLHLQARMLSFEPLPHLPSKINKEIPLHIQQRLQYQWKSMNQMASSPSSIQIAHHMAAHFSKLAHEYSADLPKFVTDKICRYCSSFLVPSLSSIVRLVKRKKEKDEIVLTCLKCNRVTERTQKPRMRPRTRKRTVDTLAKEKDSVNGVDNSKRIKSFSFLEKSRGGSSKAGSLSGDYIPLSHVQVRQQPQHTIAGDGMNLLEMERENKRRKKQEKRKQRAHADTTQVSSLKSLKNIFNSGINPTYERFT